MAKIGPIIKSSSFFKNKKLLFVLFIILWSAGISSQDTLQPKPGKRMVELKHADEAIDEIEKITGRRVSRLLGNVIFKHNEIFMYCDSAHFYSALNQIKAYSRVHIEQGDTIDLHGDYLFYDGASENASVKGNVELINKDTHLYTDSIQYDVRNKIARYNHKGKIINNENTLTSIIGIYYVNDDLFHFKDSVRIVNPDYIMTADTMDYNTLTETSFFTGPSEITGDSLYLYCEKGWYDTKNDISRIWKNALIDNRQQVIRGDSIYYEGQTGYGLSFGNISITDTTNNIIVKGDYAWYYKDPERFMVTDKALFIQVSDKDSLFLHADTINAVTVTDSAGLEYRLMRAYKGCRIYSDDIQAKCDSLSYSFQDSVIRLYTAPVLWSKEYQLTADTMALFTKNRQADRLELNSSAFVVAEVDTTRYDQLKGRKLTGFFLDNEIYKINIEGNGETIYYLVDGEEVAGINRAKCSRIEIYVKEGKIQEILELENPEGVIDPPLQPGSDLKLEGFNWYDLIRPKKMSDIFIK